MSSGSAVSEIDSWLQGLGLSQYAEAFRTNDITAKRVLLSLDDGDLRSIGVGSLGHRKMMLASIAKMHGANSPRPGVQGGAPQQAPVIEVKSTGGSGVWKVVGWLIAITLVLIIASMAGC